MKRRVQRSLVDFEHVLRRLLDALGDRPAVLRLLLKRTKDQEVESALEEVERPLRGCHSVECRHQSIAPLVSNVNTNQSKHVCNDNNQDVETPQRDVESGRIR